MEKIKIIEDGNFARWFRVSLAAIGLGMMYCAVKLPGPPIWSGIVLLAGLGIAAVGGYASQAHMLKIKPFGNNWKKVRRSYEVKGDEQDKS